MVGKGWERTLPVVPKEENRIFPHASPPKRKVFVAPTEEQAGQTSMGLLLGWEYGRLWILERDKYLRETQIKAKSHHIMPDFKWWLDKRSIVLDRRKLYSQRQKSQRQKTQPQGVKNHDLSAFAVAKRQRLLHEKEYALRMSGQESKSLIKSNEKCTCKECKRKLYCSNLHAQNQAKARAPGGYGRPSRGL